jgi:hypothetical protein
MRFPITGDFSLETADLLAAHAAGLRKEMRPVFRFLLIGFGALWFFGGLFEGFSRGLSWRVLFYLVVGAVSLWNSFLSPVFERRQIRAEGHSGPRVHLSLDENRIVLRREGQAEAVHEWSGVLWAVSTRKGVLLAFQDGTGQWLPKRVLGEEPSRKELISFLRTRGLL